MSWIEQRVGEIARFNEAVRSGFAGMETGRMDFKQGAGIWSINECFDHIIQSNRRYYPILDAIRSGTYQAGPWAHFPIVPRLLGRMVLRIVSPDYQGRSKTSRKIFPLQSSYGRNLTVELLAENEVLLEKIRPLEDRDPDTTIVSSPVNSLVSYSLRDCVQLLVDHEQRHLNQARRLKGSAEQGWAP